MRRLWRKFKAWLHVEAEPPHERQLPFMPWSDEDLR